MTDDLLRVGTWNIFGRQTARAAEPGLPGAVLPLVKDAALDVLCLQEVHFYRGRPDPVLVRDLSAAGLTSFVGRALSPSHLDGDAELGVAIAARRPLAGVECRILRNPGLRAVVRGQDWTMHDKGLVSAHLEVRGRTVRVCSLHLFPFHEFGVEEDDGHVAAMWRELWGHLRDTGGQRPAILAGDFNQVNRQEAARRWGRSGRWSFLLADKVTTDFGLALDDVAVNWRPSDIATEVVPSFSDHHLAIVEIRSPVLRPSLVAASARREA